MAQFLPPTQLMHVVDPHPLEPGSQAQRHIPVQAGSVLSYTHHVLSSELVHGNANLCRLAADRCHGQAMTNPRENDCVHLCCTEMQLSKDQAEIIR